MSRELFVVADDENNILRIYNRSKPPFAITTYDLSDFLQVDTNHPEADIEGATVAGSRIYWITSHGRNSDGRFRSGRSRFFATDFSVTGSEVEIKPAGSPYKLLIHKLVNDRRYRQYLEKAADLRQTAKGKKLENLAPKRMGLNIEGLCASADGRTLYIGFRNPLITEPLTLKPSALVVPLENPDQVVENSAEPVFGPPLLWDLNGLGIRSMTYSSLHGCFFIVAGTADDKSDFALYYWSGKTGQSPRLGHKPEFIESNFTPEGLMVLPESSDLWFVSDDGGRIVTVSGTADCLPGKLLEGNKCLNKHLADNGRKTFRVLGMTIEREILIPDNNSTVK